MNTSFQIYAGSPGDFSGSILALFVQEETWRQETLISPALAKAISHPLILGDFPPKPDCALCLYPALMNWYGEKPWQADRIFIITLPDENEPRALREQLRLCAGTLVSEAKRLTASDALVIWPENLALPPCEAVRELVEGLALGAYTFPGYKKEEEENASELCRFHLFQRAALSEKDRFARAVQEASVTAHAVCLARDMGNTPANRWTPASFAAHARKLGRGGRLRARVLTRAELEKEGLNALLAVSQGSAQEPTLSALEYLCGPENPTLLLVGKGLTFDSGGLCLKPPAGMNEMKLDMCGGAVVMALMEALAALAIPGINVVGLVPATENLSGAAALKPGDVVCHYGGLHTEVVNTDAEGRLILADALAWGIARWRPDAIIDLATLTGAAIVGLGHHYSGLFSNNDTLADHLMEAGAAAGEPFWRLPLGAEYRKQLDSPLADLKNAADRSGGAITAACYLQSFVGETPWAHLDIAGTAWNFTEKSYVPKGASGIGVRTLLRALAAWPQTRLA